MIHHYNPKMFILKREHMTTLFKKELIFAVIVLFIGSSITPTIIGDDGIISARNTVDITENTVYGMIYVTASKNTKYNGSLSGYITDPSMNPIKGAIIRALCGEDCFENISDSSGYYYIDNIPIIFCLWNISASKTGYKTIWVETSIGENTTLDFVMTPLGETLYVGGSGPGNYSDIQDAIDNADDGDMVFVYDGVYEENIKVNKNIQLIGENRNTTIIDGGNKRDVVKLTADGVTVKGFTIRNGGSTFGYAGGILLDPSSNSVISDNIIIDNELYGIWVLENESSYTTISNNIISGNGKEETGGLNIWLYQSSHNTISGNIIEKGIGYGLAICYWSTRTTVTGNIIADNRLEGIKSRYCFDNNIYGNTIKNNNYFGIRILNASANNIIEHNTLINNKPIDAFFTITDSSISNQWNGNYWGRSRMFPKPVIGCIKKDMKYIPWINFDWHPAEEPYDIQFPN
jgi:parallel beta-helix repeat protein